GAVPAHAEVPAYDGPVNDYANIIPDDREAILEQKILDYEKITSVEIAVVTTPSLEDDSIENYANTLFNTWGIGQKALDNGVLILVAPTEREYRIEVGRGLEDRLTDAASDALGRETLPDAFRAGDYAGGIENLTGGIIDLLGTKTLAERVEDQQRLSQQRALDIQKAKDAFNGFLMSVLLFLVVVAVLVAAVFAVLGLIRGYRTWRKNQRLREEVLGSLSSTGGVSMRLRAALKHCTLPILPIWAEESERSHREAFDHVLDEEASTRVKVRSLLRRNPSEAAKLMEVVKQRLIEAQELLVYFQSTPERIKAFRTETYAKVREATSLADALLTRAKKLEQDGYGKMVAAFASQIATVKSDMEKLRTACAECGEGAKDTSHLVQQKAAKVVESVNACSTPLELLLHKQQSTAERIRRIRQRMKEFP
ncbi:MAG: TPM domain-containing protein, partial [Patescibacteria group bacterium]